MKQIGARDDAKLIGGYGRCGRQLAAPLGSPNFTQSLSNG